MNDMNPYLFTLMIFLPVTYFIIKDFILYKRSKKKNEEQKMLMQENEEKLEILMGKMKQQQQDLFNSFQEVNKLSEEGGLFEIDDSEEKTDKNNPKP
jgi:hypothetical protein